MRFFRLDRRDASPVATVPTGYELYLWRPSLGRPLPPGAPRRSLVWWMMHALRVFSNRDYAVLVIQQGGQTVHRSAVFPRWLRSPFMQSDDLQVGDTFTDSQHRGQGLAVCALQHIVHELGVPGRAFWYLVDDDNAASIRAVQKAGFLEVGTGERVARFGIRLLGAHQLTTRLPH